MIGDDIIITNAGLWHERKRFIKLGIEAPLNVRVMRLELLSEPKKPVIKYKKKKKMIEVSE